MCIRDRYTSERAKQKVVDLAKLVSKYSGPMRLYVVNFTEIQMYIYDKCPHDELTIIMRRYMMKIAEYFANKEKAQGLITGESIGQVASQTMQSLAATNEVCTMPVFRPVDVYKRQPQAFLDVFEEAKANGDQIIGVMLSGGISAVSYTHLMN